MTWRQPLRLIDSHGVSALAIQDPPASTSSLSASNVHRESRCASRRGQAVLAATPGRAGMTVYYYRRGAFPQLTSEPGQRGPDQSPFPRPSFGVGRGALARNVLLRARSSETAASIIAPAQCGEPDDGRRTYGHSLIINPGGEIIAEARKSPGVDPRRTGSRSSRAARAASRPLTTHARATR